MTGSALFDFLISIILLLAVGFIFFLVVDRIAPEPTLNKIGKIAVGVVLLVVFLFACKSVFFGGGGGLHIDPKGFLYFAIGVIVVLIALFIIQAVLDWIAAQMGMGAPIVEIIKYVIFGVALIALLVLADRTLLGGSITGSFNLRSSLPIDTRFDLAMLR